MRESRGDPAGRTRWDANQYRRFERERSRPFHDLLARVPDGDVRRIADLGCGDGKLTRLLLERWPYAQVWGVDSSRNMLASALASPTPPRLCFVHEDLRSWRPPLPLDLVVSNAALHWLPDHAGLLDSLAERLAPCGVLAVQIPNHHAEPAYRILDALLAEPAWSGRLRLTASPPVVESPAFYEERLLGLGFDVQLWETLYYHRLAAPIEIIEWLKGTTLRPHLSGLSAAEAADFLAALTPRILAAYPADSHGIVFPFRRLFFVARRSPGGQRRSS